MPEVVNVFGYQAEGWQVPVVLLGPLYLIIAAVVAKIVFDIKRSDARD